MTQLDDVIRQLQFDRITGQLTGLTQSRPGGELAARLVPSFEWAEVGQWLDETGEGLKVLSRYDPYLAEVSDICDLAVQAEKGGVLSGAELIRVRGVLSAAARLRRWLKDDLGDVPRVAARLTCLSACPDLAESIDQAIDGDGEIKDSASPQLARLRSAIAAQAGRIRNKLDEMVRSPSWQRWLQEPIYTMRNQRFVLPVKAEHRRSVRGIIHDQSASGATLFIEPEVIVSLTNELKCLQLAEQQECERILAGLAAEVGRYREGLTENVRLLAELDFIFAKARLAVQQRATRPLLGKGEELCLRNARHPLLPDRTVVPITVTMEGRKQLLITGPNTGGKTVAMKTIGLLSLMAQAGLFVPAAEGSRLPLFGGYYADIGDGQSIERNLSTFSGHLLNVIRILEQSHGEDLVLLDEIGTGTDPEEGAGLAVAVLEEMLSRPATVVATSHYPQLKLYAHNNRLVECAAVEFDEQDLTPTFRLLIGHSGGSNALATARRLGLPPSIIAAARQKLSDNYRQFDDALAELRQRCRQLAEQQAETERLNRQLAGELASWREGEQARLHRAEKLLVEARERAGRLVADARLQAGQLLDRLRELDRQLRERAAAVPALDRTAAEVSGRLEELSKQFQPGEEEGNERPAGRPAVPGRLAAGDRVYVHSLRRVATVKAVGEKEIVVQHQAFQARVGWEDCQLAEDGEEPERPGLPAAHRHLTGHRREFQSLVDLRGMTVEEAIIAADRHIDNALFCGAREVMLLHGKGTGALRAGLRRHFLRDARVEQITLAELSQGGTGVSVVRLK